MCYGDMPLVGVGYGKDKDDDHKVETVFFYPSVYDLFEPVTVVVAKVC